MNHIIDMPGNNGQALSTISLLMGLLFGLVMIVGILNGGTYFASQRFLLESLIIILGFFFCWTNRQKAEFNVTPILLIIMVFLILAGMTIFWAVNQESALDSITMYAATVVFIAIVSNLEYKVNILIFQVLYTAITVIAVICLISACLLPLAYWYLPEPGSGVLRVSGPFYYANTMAVVFAAFWLSGPSMMIKRVFLNIKVPCLNIGQVLLMAGLLLTQSRAAFLLTFFALFYCVLNSNLKETWKTFSFSLVGGCAVALLITWFRLPGLILSLGLICLLQYALAVYKPGWLEKMRCRFGAFIIAAILVALLAASKQLVGRIGTISFKAHTLLDRVAYWQDAWKIIKDYPWGTGVGGWRDLYPQYQSFAYYAQDVHNSYLQLVLELGLPMLFLILAGVGLSVYLILKNLDRLKQPEYPLIASALVLLIHPILDFDWSFMSVWMVSIFITHMALNNTLDQTVAKLGKWRKGAFIFIVVTSLLVGAQYSSHILWQTGLGHIKSAPQSARGYLTWSVRLNLLSAPHWIGLARAQQELFTLELSDNQGSPGSVQSLELRSKALNLRPYSSDIYSDVGLSLVDEGQLQAAWPYLYRSLELSPYQLRRYQKASSISLQIAESYLGEGKLAEARTWLAKPSKISVMMNNNAQKQPTWPKAAELLPLKDSRLEFNNCKVLAYLGNYESAIHSMQDLASDPVLCSEATEWKILIIAKRDDLSLNEALSLAEREGVDRNAFLNLWGLSYPLLQSIVD